jgi:CTP synthase
MEGQKGKENTGGTMRLGDYACHFAAGSLAAKLYGTQDIVERHRHRYEAMGTYVDEYESWGITASGMNPDNGLVEVIEGVDHPFLMASQYHPEFKSRPNHPHPMFQGFIAALKNK